MSKDNVLNRYSGMQFPDYRFKEYPKIVSVKNGTKVDRVLVKNEWQEKKVLEGAKEDVAKVKSENQDAFRHEQEKIVGFADKDSILKRAKDVGIAVPKNANVETIKRLLEDHEAALEIEKEGLALEEKSGEANTTTLRMPR